MAFTPEEFQSIEGYFGSTQPRIGTRNRLAKKCIRHSIDSIYSLSTYDTEYETLSHLLDTSSRRTGHIFSDKFTVVDSVLKLSLMRRLRSLVKFSNASFTSSKFTNDSGIETVCSHCISPEYSEAADSDVDTSNNLGDCFTHQFNSYDLCEELKQHDYESAECPVENVYQDPDVVLATKKESNIYQDPNSFYFDTESSCEFSRSEDSTMGYYQNGNSIHKSTLFNESGETIASISSTASTNNGLLDSIIHEYMMCTLHKNQALTLFCSSHNCRVAACGICAVEYHKGSHHKLVAISQIPKVENEEDIKYLAHKIKDRRNFIQQSLRKIDNKGKQLNTNLTLIQKEVMKTFQNCRDVLDQREQEVLTEVSMSYRDLRSKILDKRNEIKKSLVMLDDRLPQKSRTLGKTATGHVKSQRMRNTLTELDMLEEKEKHEKIGILGYIRNINVFTNALQKLGDVIVLNRKPTMFILDKGAALQGWRYKLKIEMVNTNGHDVSELLTLTLTGPTGQSLPTELTNNKDGTHTISFTPQTLGTYKLNPTVFGHSLLEKPINIPVWVPTLIPEHHGNTRPYRVKVVAMDGDGCAQMLPPNLPFVARFIRNKNEEIYCNTSYSEGKYCVTYNLRKPGDYSMNILLHDQHILYSPMHLTYQTRPLNKATIHSGGKLKKK
ncbi:uncharacterized protein LOC117116402 [Anneissia japonica]|uniref:uncharacterized protein LOC117116402 n=1 Tax=Anneissia japonica TaxID=1529436 RepID=UPI0014259C05|nr:uncharacterized protein LOC117116402 [Anneissia japonica]